MSDIPQLVYQVQTDQNGDPYIAEHELVAKSGSWTTTRRKDGTVVKEHGLYRWHATVMEAIEYEAAQIMLWYTMPRLFKPKMLEERMGWLLRESYEWGLHVQALEDRVKTRESKGIDDGEER